MVNALRSFFKDESGATAVEYGVVVGLAAVLLIAAMIQIGVKFNGIMSIVTDTIGAVLERVNGSN